MPALVSTHGMAFAASMAGQGRAPLHSALMRVGDRPFGPVQSGEEDATLAVDRVGDDLAILQLQIERGLDDPGRHLQQLDRHRHQLRQRQPAVALVHCFGERVADAGAGPDHRRLLDAELRRDLIGALEADAADVARKPVGVLRDQPDGVGAIGLEDAHRPRRADTVAVQEDHDLADRLLIGPGGDDAVGALGPDAVDLFQPCRRLLDDVEDLLAERLDQLLGVDRADALDHARGEVLLDPLGGSGRCRSQEIGAELHAMCPIVDPPAARLDELAGADRRGMADDGDQIALAARLHPQDTEAAVLVVEGDPLDQAGEVLALGRGRRPRHRGLPSLFQDRRALALQAARRVSQSLIEQPSWHVQQRKALFARRRRILGRLDGDLDSVLAEKDLNRDLGIFEVNLVPTAVVPANDCMRHGLSSLRHP